MDLTQYIREIADFPKPGIMFKDLTPLFGDAGALAETVARMSDAAAKLGITHVAGIESRGFILGGAIALRLGVGFIPIRKPGKLPAETISESYDLEYGSDRVEMHKDALKSGDRVLIVDDLLATGGTMGAAVKLVEKSGATVAGIVFAVELGFLGGRKQINGYNVTSLLIY